MAFWPQRGRRWQMPSDPARRDAQRAAAQAERRAIDAFLVATDPAQDTPRVTLEALALPTGTDWRWRLPALGSRVDPAVRITPASGEGLGGGVDVYHDDPSAPLILTQLRATDREDLAPYNLRLEVMGFGGRFVSLAVPLPPEAISGLTRQHILRLETRISIERDVQVFARLNVENGPDVERLQWHLGWMRTERVNHHVSEFDLAQTVMDETRVTKAWIDLILDAPAMNAVTLHDVVASRHLRADI